MIEPVKLSYSHILMANKFEHPPKIGVLFVSTQEFLFSIPSD
jgi:hypothetical protein